MMLLNWVNFCYCTEEIQKKEINLRDLENNNLLTNNNKYLQIQNKTFKERKTTNSSIINGKNVVEQNNNEKFSDNDFSPLSNNKKITPPNEEVKTVKTHQFKINHAHFPKINTQFIESDIEKEKKIKKVRNTLMKDLF